MDSARFGAAPTFPAYLASVEKNRELWHAVWDRVSLPAELIAEARLRSDAWRLVAVTEDWCGDAVNTLPAVARLAEEAGWELRCFARDANPDIMDGHLTNGRSRSIPIVIAYDADFEEIGWWGPRPREIQEWVMTDGLAMPSPERYKVIRRWYAQDKGRTTLEEILKVIPARYGMRRGPK